MKVFYGSAIQGARDRRERAFVHRTLIQAIKDKGFEVASEHTTGKTKEEAAELLETSIGPLPPKGPKRTNYIRGKMIESIEGDIKAAVFEVSVPSIGTGVEIAHAYLRPRMGLAEIPILLLYQRDFWPNDLSSMIRGITPDDVPKLKLVEYTSLEEARSHVLEFLGVI